MTRTQPDILALADDESGQTTIEWALVLLVFVLPMIVLLNMLLSVLVEHYRMVTFLETLPFP